MSLAEAQQMSIFAPRAPVLTGDPDGLRPYQRDAVTAIMAQLGDVRSTLLVMATGLGKTQTFGAVAKHWPGKVLVLAHRDELIQQAAKRLERMTGEYCDIEQASFRAAGARLVCGSVQTLARQKRLQRFAPDRFDLIVIDEAHHAIAKSYTTVLDHFAGARVLGVTATPDRGDERALGKVFDSVAYRRDIHDGIDDGYLAPVRTQHVVVDAIDLSGVRTVAGDLNQGDLDAVMRVEEALHGVVKPTVDLAGDRQTIVFSTSVDNAHRLAEIFNRYRPNCARAVDGDTHVDERRALLRAHKAGEFQFLCNVGVLTEGYDDPSVSCIAMARPTKSRALYVQCVGRGLRTLDGIGALETADERRAAIASSRKADCLVLDFVGNSGKHELVSAVDVLGGKYSEDTRKRAAKLVAQTGMLVEDALAEAQRLVEEQRQRETARRAAIKASVQYRINTGDPWTILHARDPGLGGAIATEGQLRFLGEAGVTVPKGCTKEQAGKLIANIKVRQARGLASFKQLRTLARYGVTDINIGKGKAHQLIDAIAANSWKAIPREQVAAILGRQRTAGEEG